MDLNVSLSTRQVCVMVVEPKKQENPGVLNEIHQQNRSRSILEKTKTNTKKVPKSPKTQSNNKTMWQHQKQTNKQTKEKTR